MEEKCLYKIQILKDGKYYDIYVDKDEYIIDKIRETFIDNKPLLFGMNEVIIKNS